MVLGMEGNADENRSRRTWEAGRGGTSAGSGRARVRPISERRAVDVEIGSEELGDGNRDALALALMVP